MATHRVDGAGSKSVPTGPTSVPDVHENETGEILVSLGDEHLAVLNDVCGDPGERSLFLACLVELVDLDDQLRARVTERFAQKKNPGLRELFDHLPGAAGLARAPSSP